MAQMAFLWPKMGRGSIISIEDILDNNKHQRWLPDKLHALLKSACQVLKAQQKTPTVDADNCKTGLFS